MKYVLDSNIVIAAMNRSASVRARLDSIDAANVGIPVVVIGELLYGARRSTRVDENIDRVQAVRRAFAPLRVTVSVAERYALPRSRLEAKGLPKSDFDLVIAATALVHDATLVTNDTALLDGSIEALEVEDWLTTR